MRGFLRAAIVGVGLALSACGILPPAEPECLVPTPVLEYPIKMIVVVYPQWEFPAEDVRAAYLLLIGKDEIVKYTGEEYREDEGLQALVKAYDTWNSPIPVKHITLDVVRKETI